SHARRVRVGPVRPGVDPVRATIGPQGVGAGRMTFRPAAAVGAALGLRGHPRMSTAAEAAIAPDAVLDALEAEAIHIFREAAGAFRRPVILYSIGKDSTVLLHLAVKAFAPGKVPFPILHIDTTW